MLSVRTTVAFRAHVETFSTVVLLTVKPRLLLFLGPRFVFGGSFLLVGLLAGITVAQIKSILSVVASGVNFAPGTSG